jgi:hypothetical protein
MGVAKILQSPCAQHQKIQHPESDRKSQAIDEKNSKGQAM